MLTKQNKAGLVLAFLLGLSDIAILGSAGDDGGPPTAIVVISVIIGVATLVLVVMAWRSAVRNLMLAIITLRVLSGVGDIGGLWQSAGVVIFSIIALGLTVVDVYLLRNCLKQSPAGG